ncbi:RHS repeat-associated core domain-containing protein [Pseudomonas sp. zfem002]|uniref:RHS repeat-associated core domain-containing protein n=1 Tax=Pseudomonas sp. zfem002 TaxID=3078197 RepID=UPI0029283FDA|nr:RHS repeat-associated core domain-containing protein [Pseudomonas sp. zfem002]MDU9392476.1 RHS repeat-associated core domain-containing protein [Pseudomonas sp. zfem002]
MLAKGRKAAPITLADLTFLPVMTHKVQRYTPSILYSVCTMAIPEAGPHAVLFACDSQQSILAARSAEAHDATAYSPYGQRHARPHVARPGFNGELPEPATGHYLLGNGYRAYNPVLMRFHQPDSWSPFGAGGLNPYVYCIGDPVNRRDPTGHMAWMGTLGLEILGMASTRRQVDQGAGESSLLPWFAIGIGVAMVGAAAGMLARWKQRTAAEYPQTAPPQTEPLDLSMSRRDSVIQFAPPRQSPSPPQSPIHTVSIDQDLAARQVHYRRYERPTALDLDQLKAAIKARDGASFSRTANIPGRKAAARRLLNTHLPGSERRRGNPKEQFRGLDARDLMTRGIDPQLQKFLEDIYPTLRR